MQVVTEQRDGALYCDLQRAARPLPCNPMEPWMDRPEPDATATDDTPVQAVDPRLLDILVCPVTRTPVVLRAGGRELWCRASGLAYPVRDGIPVMLEHEARELSAEERGSL